ncbi:hypothetical protein GA0111570_101163 [Raineyella antarctica]|uniref:Lipoprotein antigen n=1 Tax=Raineyella antarctica TaxID=1577474 RepID=A0A1G6GD17_9ACTN|nr:lipoprotein LpqH [Raineyella antarctica]SDB79892.1 hypothetical protein GA0111570_101163 [Raineyella antarctica]
MTAPARPYLAPLSPVAHRRTLGTGLLLAVLALAGCTGTVNDAGSATTAATPPAVTSGATAGPTGPTTSPSVVPSQLSTEQVISGTAGTTSAAEAVLELDGSPVRTGTARCARAIDESTDHPTIRLILASADQKQNAEVVVTDGPDPTVVSAVVMRDGGALAGAEGLDGSTLKAKRKGDAFSISGTLKDQSDAGTHELRLQTTCVGL